ncbi:transposase InsO family protein [Arthrobacter roseus]|nr:transposase InsO family protein [Arthrobacter roseus]
MTSLLSIFQVYDRNAGSVRKPAQELRLIIITLIERTYHRRRRQEALGKLTPIEFETINKMALAA